MPSLLRRRQIVRWGRAMGVIVLCALLSSCLAQSSTPAGEASGGAGENEEGLPPQKVEDDPDVLRVGLLGDEVTMDPAEIPGDDAASALVARHLYRRLVRVCPAGAPHPDIAVKWRADDGGRVWEFTLCDDAVMHDDTPITADLLRDMYADAGEDSPRQRRLQDVHRIEASDESTLRFYLYDRQPEFPARVAGDPALSVGIVGNDGGVVGSGPYEYIRHSSRGGIIARAVEASSGDERFASIEFLPLCPDEVTGSPDQRSVETEDLLADMDVLAPLGPAGAADLCVQLGLREEMVLSPNVRGVAMNDRGILDDPEVRRGVFLALGRGEDLLEDSDLCSDTLISVDAWLPAGHSLQDESRAHMSLPRDAAEAEEQLREAGLDRHDDGTWMRLTEAEIGVPIELEILAPRGIYSDGEAVARGVAGVLKDFGVRVDITFAEWADFSTRFFAGDYDLAVIGWHRSTPVADGFLRPWMHSDGSVSINADDHLGVDRLFAETGPAADEILHRSAADYRLLPLYSAPMVLLLSGEVDVHIDDDFLPLLAPRDR